MREWWSKHPVALALVVALAGVIFMANLSAHHDIVRALAAATAPATVAALAAPKLFRRAG
jgi:hypothetical protein